MSDDYDWDKARSVAGSLDPAQRQRLADIVAAALVSDAFKEIEDKQVSEYEAADKLGCSVKELRMLVEMGAIESLTRSGKPWPEDVPLPPLPKEH